MKKENAASSATARSIGMEPLFEYSDEENELTAVYGISREKWARELRGR